MPFTFGCDPEFMLVDGENYRSAIGIVGGNREKPVVIGNYTFYYDNVLAEMTVPPAKSKQQAIENIRQGLEKYKQLLDPHGVRLIAQAAQNYPKKELRNKSALQAGCAIESCAYECEDLSKAKAKTNKVYEQTTLRAAGGHIHLGTPLGQNGLSCYSLIRMMDLFVGVPSLTLDDDHTSYERRKIYGQAGRYRQPTHGAEYRTLGNFWLRSPDLVGLIYDLCEFVIGFCENKHHEKFWTIDEETLTSDNFWNEIGDPKPYHRCHGYDVDKLRALFSTTPQNNNKFLQIVKKHLPPKMYKSIVSTYSSNDLYKEWCL